MDVGRALARILLGLVMLKLLATVAFQVSFAGLWSDGYHHGVSDFLLASYGTLAHLYFNFAGFTNIVIGLSALLGIQIKENFNSPLLAQSIKEFWNRWHITLSEFVRDLLYTPLAVGLTRRLGVSYVLPSAIFAALVTFVVIGLWHQFSLGFLVFGLMHGIGFGTNILFEHWGRKKRRGATRGLRARAVLNWFLTITYISMTMVFIEFSTMDQIRAALTVFQFRW